jgi:hypothetical protein
MPRRKKGEGFLDDLKSFGLSAAKDVGRELIPIAKDYAISAAKSALTKKTGTGLYATRGSGYTLSPAQARSLMAGKGVQLKQSMMGGDYEMEMTPAMEKKLARAFAKGKGMRVGAHNLKGVKKGGFIVPMLMTAARIAAPILIEKLAEAGIKKLGGKMGGDVLDNTKFMAGLAMGKVPKKKGGYIGQMPPMGAFSRIPKGGMGLFAGGGMNTPDGVETEVIQTGSPYQNTNSPAMNPFIPTRNPFGMYAPH